MIAEIVLTAALTLFGESAGESVEGKRAVASVVWLRAGGDPARVVRVCKAPRQFSCWNRPGGPVVPADEPSRRAWAECVAIARELAAGTFVPTIRADHYHAVGLKPPWWTARMTRVGTVGGHVFWMNNSITGGR